MWHTVMKCSSFSCAALITHCLSFFYLFLFIFWWFMLMQTQRLGISALRHHFCKVLVNILELRCHAGALSPGSAPLLRNTRPFPSSDICFGLQWGVTTCKSQHHMEQMSALVADWELTKTWNQYGITVFFSFQFLQWWISTRVHPPLSFKCQR